jgi:two-component system response regulator
MSEELVEILMVEDNPHDEELALHALKKHDFPVQVTVVRDGAEALDYLFCKGDYSYRRIENTPKVILLDLKLPKVDGLQVLQRIKTDPRTKNIPIVVLTSSRHETDIMKSYKLGVNSYIVKPVDYEQFTDTVRQLGFYWITLNEPPAKG